MKRFVCVCICVCSCVPCECVQASTSECVSVCTNWNSADIMQVFFAPDYLYKVLKLCVWAKRLTTVTNYLVEVINIKELNMYMQFDWAELHFKNENTIVGYCETIL